MRKTVGVILLLVLLHGLSWGEQEIYRLSAAEMKLGPSTRRVGDRAVLEIQKGAAYRGTFARGAFEKELDAGLYEGRARLQVSTVATLQPAITIQWRLNGGAVLARRAVIPPDFEGADRICTFRSEIGLLSPGGCSVQLSADGQVDEQFRLAVKDVEVRKVETAAVRITYLLPDKIIYYCREPVRFDLSITNYSRDRFSGRLSLAVFSDLERKRQLAARNVTIAPSNTESISVKWKAPEEEFGYEVRASLYDGAGQMVHERREYFSVADNLWKVAMTGPQISGGVPFTPSIVVNPDRFEVNPEGDIKAGLATRRHYVNWREFYAWAPSDFFNLAPDCGEDDIWWSGTGPYMYSKRKLRSMIEGYHANGIRVVTYAQPFAMGTACVPYIRRHPEWFAYGATGNVAGQFIVDELCRLRGPGHDDLTRKPIYNWASATLNLARLDVVDFGLQQVVKSAQMFGWDGVRWDNTWYLVQGGLRDITGKPLASYGDPQQLTVRNVKRMEEVFRKELGPRFVWGANWEYGRHRDAFPDAWDEMARSGGLMMHESHRKAYDRRHPLHRWEDFVAQIDREVRHTAGLGGHHLTIGFDEQHNADQLYLQILTFALRSHPYSHQYHLASEEVPGNYARFMTRYSALIWDVAHLTPIEDPERLFSVKAPHPLWWKRFVCRRLTPDGRVQYIVHLVNPPLSEAIYEGPPAAVPAPCEDVRIAIRPPAGESVGKVVALTAEPKMSAGPVPVTTAGDRTIATLRKVRYWTVLVFEMEG